MSRSRKVAVAVWFLFIASCVAVAVIESVNTRTTVRTIRKTVNAGNCSTQAKCRVLLYKLLAEVGPTERKYIRSLIIKRVKGDGAVRVPGQPATARGHTPPPGPGATAVPGATGTPVAHGTPVPARTPRPTPVPPHRTPVPHRTPTPRPQPTPAPTQTPAALDPLVGGVLGTVCGLVKTLLTCKP